MCLEIIARILPDSKGRVSARRLSEHARLRVASVKFRGASALHFSVSGGCSCEFLSDSAEFESPVWALNPEHLNALAEAISLLASEAGPFTFLARWLGGELPEGTSEVKPSALIEDIKQNRVRNNVLYLVR
jgi:hypothetical protein